MSRRISGFIVFVLLSMTIVGSVFGQEGRSARGGKGDPFGMILPLIEEMDSLPPIEMEYDFGFELEDGSFSVRRHRFLQSGKMWREEMRDDSGTLRIVIAYDGERYYRWSPVAENLHVTKDPEDPNFVRMDILNTFRANPFYAWAVPFFLNARSSFDPKGLTRPSVWSEALMEFSIRGIAPKNGGKRLLFDALHLQFETEFVEIAGGSKRVGEIILRHKNRASGELKSRQTQIKLNGWHVEKIGKHSIALPKEVIGVTHYNDGRELVGGDSWSRLVAGSVRALPKDVPLSAFRVPLSSVPDPVIKD